MLWLLIRSCNTVSVYAEGARIVKMSYFGYSLERVSDKKHFIMDLRPFLRAFVDLDSVAYKNGFKHGGEHVYFFPMVKNVYLFVITRSKEIIKRIQSSDLSVGEIYDLLQSGEMIGFASYVYIDECYFGFASTIMAPKVATFAQFVNDVMRSAGLSGYAFSVHPMLRQSTRGDVLSMPFIGKTRIQVNRDNSFFEDLRSFVGGTAEEFSDVGSFEVVVKPRRGKSIDVAVKRIVDAVPDNGLDKMVVSAKSEIQGQLIDLYLAGEGVVSDTFDAKDEGSLYETIVVKVESNTVLSEKVSEYERDERFEKKDIEDILNLHDSSSWPPHILDL